MDFIGLILFSTFGFLLLSYKPAQKVVVAPFEKAKRFISFRVQAWMYLFNGRHKIFDAYAKANGNAFHLLTPDNDLTFVSSETHIKEISDAPNGTLSLHAASKQVLQPHYTMHGFNWHDKRGIEGLGFIRALRTLLTNHLPLMTPELKQITEKLFSAKLEQARSVNGETCVPAYLFIKHMVSRISGFAFFGKDLMEDDEFMDAALGYIEQVLIGAEILRLVPRAFLPAVASFMSLRYRCQYTLYHVLMGVVTHRLEIQACGNPGPKPNDCIQWIMDTAPKANPWSSERIVYEIMAIWFGSVHGLSTTLTYALYDLCVHDEYKDRLRAEVEGDSMDQFNQTGQGLPFMDSFLKESSRLTPVEAMTTRRQALEPFTFSDGTHIKQGQWTCVALGAMLHDPELYPEPLEFNGFRFVEPSLLGAEKSMQPEGASKLTDVSYKWQVWGSGKMTCAGRFYVAYVMKLIMSHTLLNYDCKLVDTKAPRSTTWRSLALPVRSTEVMFKPRNIRVEKS